MSISTATSTLRRTNHIFNAGGSDHHNRDDESFITLQSMLILLIIITFLIICLCGCVLFGRNTNTLFTYKNDYLTNSRNTHCSHSNHTTGTTTSTTTTAAAAAATTTTNIIFHSSESSVSDATTTSEITEPETVGSSSKCFGVINVRTATTESTTFSNQDDDDDNDNDAVDNGTLWKNVLIQAEFDNGNDIIDISNDQNNANYDNPGGNFHLYHNACCIICLVEYAHGDRVYRNHPFCSHVFHTHCLQQWIQPPPFSHKHYSTAATTTTNTTATSMTSNGKNNASECPCCRCPINPILHV